MSKPWAGPYRITHNFFAFIHSRRWEKEKKFTRSGPHIGTILNIYGDKFRILEKQNRAPSTSSMSGKKSRAESDVRHLMYVQWMKEEGSEWGGFSSSHVFCNINFSLTSLSSSFLPPASHPNMSCFGSFVPLFFFLVKEKIKFPLLCDSPSCLYAQATWGDFLVFSWENNKKRKTPKRGINLIIYRFAKSQKRAKKEMEKFLILFCHLIQFDSLRKRAAERSFCRLFASFISDGYFSHVRSDYSEYAKQGSIGSHFSSISFSFRPRIRP